MSETYGGRCKLTCSLVARLKAPRVPKELTFPYVLTKQCGVVPGLVDRWHHLMLLSLDILGYSNRILYSPGDVSVN